MSPCLNFGNNFISNNLLNTHRNARGKNNNLARFNSVFVRPNTIGKELKAAAIKLIYFSSFFPKCLSSLRKKHIIKWKVTAEKPTMAPNRGISKRSFQITFVKLRVDRSSNRILIMLALIMLLMKGIQHLLRHSIIYSLSQQSSTCPRMISSSYIEIVSLNLKVRLEK